VSASFVHRFEQGSGGSSVTLLLLHGTGGTENDLIPLGKELAPGAALLSPRGQVLEHGMPRWFRRFAEGVFDVPDLIARSRDLTEFVADAAKQYNFDAARVVPVGYSNGANIAASMLLLGSMKFPAAVLFRPMVPLVPEEEPDLSDTCVFIAAGRDDPLTSALEIGKLVALLEGAGATVDARLENAGHNLTSGDIQAARRWLQNNFSK
jgi:predicted esterase